MAQQSWMAMEGHRSIHLESLSLVYRLISPQIHIHSPICEYLCPILLLC